MSAAAPPARRRLPSRAGGRRDPALAIAALVVLAFVAVAAQVVRLALNGAGPRMQIAEPIVRIYARPDVVDRKGRLLATDLQAHSLFADPALVLDPDEASEKLAVLFPDLDAAELRAQLADKSRRFIWIRRGLTPALAQRVHDLGLPGLAFRTEPRRVYPQGRLAGHVIGGVNIDNRGIAGLERYIDETLGVETGYSAEFARPPVTLTIDVGVQHGLEEELALAMAQYGASGAAGVIIEAATGAVLAAASLPDVDPARPAEALATDRIDRLNVATYELGSVLKLFTVAMALETGVAAPGTVIDVRVPLQVGRWTIRDMVPSGRPLTVREVLIQSSNVGAAYLGIRVGSARQRAFLTRVGLIEPMRTEVGAVGAPRLPERWSEAETATIAYGYGIAVSPIQIAAATAALVNGGIKVRPRFVEWLPGIVPAALAAERVVSAGTSASIREMMRRAVAQPNGTARRAEAPGFEVGGKTGTAEISVRGGYQQKSVVASFLGAFPMTAPRFVVLVTLMEPRPESDTKGPITAGANAAPVAARLIARTGPLLGVVPR